METDNVTNVIEAADDPSPWPLPPDEAERIRTLKNLELRSASAAHPGPRRGRAGGRSRA